MLNNKSLIKILSLQIIFSILISDIFYSFAFGFYTSRDILRVPVGIEKRMEAFLDRKGPTDNSVTDIEDENGNRGIQLALKRNINSSIIFTQDVFNKDNRTIRDYCNDRQLVICFGRDISIDKEREIKTYFGQHFNSKRLLFIKLDKIDIEACLEICKKAKDWEADRNCIFIGIGDKDIFNITGLSARLYRRGAKYIYIPTSIDEQLNITLLLNPTILYKDTIKLGAFYPPAAIILGSTDVQVPSISKGEIKEVIDNIGNKGYGLLIPTDVKYKVVDVKNVFNLSNRAIINYLENKPIFVCVDENIYNNYGKEIEAYFRYYRPECHIISVPSGEENKVMNAVLSICEEAKKLGMGKDVIFIGIGGGALTDIVGVVATLYEGGVDYIRISTTLLGMIDAGIGVKTGINFEGSKNFLGSFYPPIVDLNDEAFLETLDRRQISCGISEMIKIAMVTDRSLFEYLESYFPDILNKNFDNEHVRKLLYFSIKDMLIELHKNLFEEGDYRRLADFGHPIAHILESLSDYRIAHGEAVAIDMAITTAIAYKRGICPKEDFFRVITLLENSELPIYDEVCENTDKIMFKLRDAIAHRGGSLNMAMPTGIGKAIFNQELEIDELKQAIDLLKIVSRIRRIPLSEYCKLSANRCVILNEQNELVIQNRPVFECSSKEMVLAILYAGVCGTDIKIVKGERSSKQGIVLGHECIARVVKIGKEVKGFEEGDLVTFNPNDPTRPDNVIGHERDGVFSKFFIVGEDIIKNGQIIKIPPTISSPLEAIFIEPLSCAVHSLGPLKKELKGKTVGIVGAGQFGRLHALVAKVYGAKKVILINRSSPNLEFAKERGIVSDEDCVLINDFTKENIFKRTSGKGADIVILATTFSIDYLRESVDLVSNNGKIVLFGGTRDTDIVAFPGGELNCHNLRVNNARKELEVGNQKVVEFIGRRAPTRDDFQEAINLLGSGRTKVSSVVSRIISLDKLPEIMEGFRGNDEILGKIVVDMSLQGKVELVSDEWQGFITEGISERKVAIIGATGDIGSQLAKTLVDRNYSVMVSVRPASLDKLSRIGDKKESVEILKGTLFSIANLKRLISQNSTICQMAGLVSLNIGEEDYPVALAVNGFSQGLITALIKKLERENTIRLIYPSTQRISLISGREDVKQWVDKAVTEFDLIVDALIKDNGDITEKIVSFAEGFIIRNPLPQNLNIYELSKLINEHFVARLNNGVILRIGHIYGEGYSLKRTIPRVIDTVVTGGYREEKDLVISPVYVQDLNDILLRLIELDEMHLGRYKLSDVTAGFELTTDELVRAVNKRVVPRGNVRLTPGPLQPSNIHQAPQKSSELLNRQFTPFDREGLDRLIKYILEQNVASSNISAQGVSILQEGPPDLIVFDVGGTTTRYGIYTSKGELLEEGKFVTSTFKTVPGKSVAELQELLLDTLRERVILLQNKHPEMQLSKVVFSFAGTIKDGGVIGKAASIWGDYVDYPFKKKFDEKTEGLTDDSKVWNDVVSASWRYRFRDRYKNNKKVCIITISTGIGYVIFDPKNPDITDTHVASLGHIKIDESPSALMCDCGERGHLAAYASGRDAERRIRIKALEDLGGFKKSALFEMAQAKIEGLPIDKRKEILADRVTKDILARLSPQINGRVVGILLRERIDYEELRNLYSDEEMTIASAIILENKEFCQAIDNSDVFALELFDEITLILAREFIKIAESGVDKFIIMGGFAQAIKDKFESHLVHHMKFLGLYGKDNQYIENLIDWAEEDDGDGLIGVANVVRFPYLQQQKIAMDKISDTLEFSRVIGLKDSILELLRENKERSGKKLVQEDVDLLNKAFVVSYIAHNILPGKAQLKDNGRWFLYHPLDVAKYLVERLDIADVQLIAATFLHDVVEHTPLSLEQVEFYFGKEILNIVLDLSQKRGIEAMSDKQLKEKEFEVEKIAGLLGIDNIQNPDAIARIARIALKIEHIDRLMYRPLDTRSRLLKVVDNIINYSSIDHVPLSRVKRREVVELEMFRWFTNSLELPAIVEKDINYYIDKLLEIPSLGPSAKSFVDGQEVYFQEKREEVETKGLDIEQLRKRKELFTIKDGVLEPDRILFEPTAIVFGRPLSEVIVKRLSEMQEYISDFFGEEVHSPSQGCIFYRNQLRQGHVTLVSYGYYADRSDSDIYMLEREIIETGGLLEKYPPLTGFLRGIQIMPDGAIVARLFVTDDVLFRMRKEIVQKFPNVRQFIPQIAYVNLGRLINENIEKEEIADFHRRYGNIELDKVYFREAVAHNGVKLPLWKLNTKDYYRYKGRARHIMPREEGLKLEAIRKNL